MFTGRHTKVGKMLNFLKRFFEPKVVTDVAIASDHRGVCLRNRLVLWLRDTGRTVTDCGPRHEEGSVDYPEYARFVADRVQCGSSKKGVLICGTGIGMSIAANKVSGIRAARVVTVEEARLSRLHNNANVLCIGENTHDVQTLVHEWLTTGFEGGRHEQRVKMLEDMDEEWTLIP